MNNQSIKELQLLKQSKHRKNKNQFIAEGKRMVGDALDLSSSVESIFCTDNFYKKNQSDWKGFGNIDNSLIHIISDAKFKKISSTSTPSGIAALCRIIKCNDVNLGEPIWIYLDKISDPGNLGTIMRTSSWFGIKNIILSAGSVDPYNPKTVRAGMGAHFGVNIYQNVELNKFVNTHTIISGSKDGKNISNFKFPKKSVLVLGNEAHGISKDIERLIQQTLTIKKIGIGESLNLASAASILMYALTNNH
tara:strand:+ start:96 stop:842 length:747 start_codon:yes stop_codon:yes gene_type:complete